MKLFCLHGELNERESTVIIVRTTCLSLLIIVIEVNTIISQQENGLKFLILQIRVVQAVLVMKIVVQVMMKIKKRLMIIYFMPLVLNSMPVIFRVCPLYQVRSCHHLLALNVGLFLLKVSL